ncbi:iron-dicitrate transporter ATP-binding subunit [Achromobacter spanius]|uniref:AAA family ATPase n=1 Tax=Achromobacter spanius TaxID=217203 RepID=UPI000C2BBC8B|nr:AAA family ATPase [Achromobacter spanius]AUA58285.1 hypothetical protein CVS48_21065 [Achromobacter spanius]CAB3682435.1 hypothetical protein LMG5911_04055 [Achromobacter spanius]SPT38496.1 iron-dicitrate transporter ATP-binding subunit [Achromobacter denitrificans]VEE59619.1 iron-dicitrate transporter ATP-binding subunit [Achromobacter spanius]
MRIESFEIAGFKSAGRNARVLFSPESVTVIYGDNGCGKTTFLKAINSFLAQDEAGLASLEIDSIICVVSENDNRHTVTVEKQDNGYGWNGFESSPLASSTSLSLGVERGVSTQVMKIEPEVLADFFAHFKYASLFTEEKQLSAHSHRRRLFEMATELSLFLRRRQATRHRNRRPEIDVDKAHLYLQSIKIENIEELLLRRYRVARFTATKKIQSALFDTLAIAVDIENKPSQRGSESKEDFSSRLLESRERIKEALDDGEDNNFKNSIISILNSIERQEELNKVLEHSLLSQLFRNMIDELEVEKLVLSSINILVERFNKYLIEDKKLVVNGTEVYIEIDGNKHSLDDLSSGERHILTFLVLVLFEGQNRHFLIIDEPEISLNIKWQRELMSIFSELLPNTQIIAASHSPALAKRNPQFLSQLAVWRAK